MKTTDILKNEIFHAFEELEMDREIVQDVLCQLIDLMENNEDDAKWNIKNNPKMKQVYDFLQFLIK